MAEHWDVAVVGGGIAGVAVAFYLAKLGRPRVVVLEQNELGSGSTGGSFGGVRQQFSRSVEVELAKRGLAFWKGLETELGHACPFHQDGYLLMTGEEAAAERLEAAAAVQRALNAGPVELLTAQQVSARFPWIDPDGLLLASWTPEDGRVTATDGLWALHAASARLGVVFRERHRVDAITRHPRGFEVTGAVQLTADTVVVATNYWSAPLLDPWGVAVAIGQLRVHSAITTATLGGQLVPLTVDLDSGMVVEREGDGLLLCMLQNPAQPFAEPADMLDAFASAAAARAPQLLAATVAKVVTAVEETPTPSGHPYVGEVAPGLWILAGFGGHGLVHAPPLAEIMAGAILGRQQTDIDLSDFDPRRRIVDNEWLQLVTQHGTETTN